MLLFPIGEVLTHTLPTASFLILWQYDCTILFVVVLGGGGGGGSSCCWHAGGLTNAGHPGIMADYQSLENSFFQERWECRECQKILSLEA